MPSLNSAKILRSAAAGGVALLAPTANAQQADITWSSSFLATNLESAGAPLDETFSFYLGVFDPPTQNPAWLPSPSNTAEWAQYWITADVALYDHDQNLRFASAYNTEALVEGVDLTGRKGYIWGVNRKIPGEWILITGSSWTWPSHGGLNFPKNWTVASGTALLGEIDSDGVHMQTAHVAGSLPPRLHPELWRKLYFTQHERDNLQAEVSGWLADPNGNGRTNAADYALGSHPRAALTINPRQVGVANISGADFLTLTVQRDPHSDALLTPLVSDDLSTWSGGPAHLAIESETPSTLVFRDLTPLGAAPRRFLRLEVLLPPGP